MTMQQTMGLGVAVALQVTITGGQTNTSSTAAFNFSNATATPTGGSGSYTYAWFWTNITNFSWTFNAGSTTATVTPRVTSAISTETGNADLYCQVADTVTGVVVVSSLSGYQYTRT